MACKYTFSARVVTIPGTGIEVGEGRLACIFERGFEEFTALVRYCSNVNFVRSLFTVVPTHWLHSHYGNQSEKISIAVSIGREGIVGINCVLYKDSRKMVTSIERGTVFIDTG